MVEFTPVLILKIVELIIAVCCLAIHDNSFNLDHEIAMLATGTFLGYTIILAGLVLGKFLDPAVPKFVDLFYTIVGVVLFIASGALIIDRSKNKPFGIATKHRDKCLAKGSLAIINSFLMIVDAVLTFTSGDE